MQTSDDGAAEITQPLPSWETYKNLKHDIRVREALQLQVTAEALTLLVELWPQPATDPVAVSPAQWRRLRQVLLAIPELGDKL